MYLNRNELTLVYNQNNEKDRKTLAYASIITSKINRQEINSVRISDTLFYIILDKLKRNGKSVINKSDPYYQLHYRGRDLEAQEWLELLRKRPDMLRSPIALYREKVIICNTPTDVLKVQ